MPSKKILKLERDNSTNFSTTSKEYDMNNSREEVIKEFIRIIGEKYVVIGDELKPYVNNVSGTKRDVIALLLPASTEEVSKIVTTANRYKIPLYPVSRGRNWGMGSRLPVRDGCIIVELSRMNRIIEVNEKFAYAVIEAGVTQKQLYDYIKEHNLPLVMDVTGSGAESSILGNALDRGVGYFTDRAEEISGLTVVLSDGSVVETGFGHYKNAKTTHLFKHGLGPSIDGLFIQGNFGIVTKAAINLLHQQEANVTFIAKLREEKNLPLMIDRIRLLRNTNIIKSVVHIGNRERARISLTPLIFEELCIRYPDTNKKELRSRAESLFHKEFYGSWSATGRLFGTKGFVKEAKRNLKKHLSDIADLMFITDDKIAFLEKAGRFLSFIPSIREKSIILAASKTVYKFTTGIPTDDAVKSVYWPFENPPEKPDPDNSECGVLYYLPITPLDGEEVRNMLAITETILREDGFDPSITLNTVNDRCLETVISIPFKREENEIKRAHNSIRRLNKKLTETGIYPYRLGIDIMSELIDEEDPFWMFVGRIKVSADPCLIISPGRYNLL